MDFPNKLRAAYFGFQNEEYDLLCKLLAKAVQCSFEISSNGTPDDDNFNITTNSNCGVIVLNSDENSPEKTIKFLSQASHCKSCAPVIVLAHFDNQEFCCEIKNAGAADLLNKNALSSELLERSLCFAIERRTLENQIAKATLATKDAAIFKQNMIANISHEFRTPLISIIGFATLLQNEVESKEHKNNAGLILESGKRLTNILNDILALAQLESDKSNISLTLIPLKPAIEEAALAFKSQAQSKNLLLSFECQNPAAAKVNNAMLKQLLHNLMDNAIKFTSKGSVKILLDTESFENSSNAVIKITDTGIGISEAFLPKAYNAFAQENPSKDRSYEGTGLGLTVAYGFATAMGGELTLSSEKGVGTACLIRFPIAMESESSLPNRLEITQPTDFKVLIVEDELTQRLTLMKFVRQLAKVVEGAPNAETALQLCTQHRFDVILLDISLDDDSMNGIEILERIRQMDGYENIPVIAVTGYAMEVEKEQFLEIGFTDYLPKPFSTRQLRELLTPHLLKN